MMTASISVNGACVQNFAGWGPVLSLPPEEFIMAGSKVKIHGRDQNPEWKLVETESGRCYLYELSEIIDAVLTE